MAFQLKNLKTKPAKFFQSMTGQQLCAILQDGEIMNFINTIPIRRDEIGNLFVSIGETCNTKTIMAPGVRQKKMAVLVNQLASIIQEWEKGKEKYYANIQAAEKAKVNAEKAAANAQAEANRKAQENLQRQANAQKALNNAKKAEEAALTATTKQIASAAETVELANATMPVVTMNTNTNMQKQLMNLKKNMNTMTNKLNRLLQSTRKNMASPAARRGGAKKRRSTRKC